MTTASRHSSLPRQSGISLIEILVGVAIGLIGILVMFQLQENMENRKRTTAAGSDAQIAGSIALYRLEQDLRLAGYGFGNAPMGCTLSAYDSSRGTPSFSLTLAPVEIVNGASGAPDSIKVLYGNSALASQGQAFTNSTTTSKTMYIRTGFQRGDLAIAAESATVCRLIEITDDTNADGKTINHAGGAYTNAMNAGVTARFNPAGGYAVTATTGTVYDLGPRDNPRRNIWQIRNGRFLMVSDDLHSTDVWAEVGEGVIDLQAEYGLDTTPTTPRDYVVDVWQTTAPTDWTRLVAIRVGLLARSQQYEKESVTTTAPSWTGGSFTMKNVDGTADSMPGDANDWRHYRYRVYETTIPLRNMQWGAL